MASPYSVADVLNLEQHRLVDICGNSWQLRTLQAIRRCRTSEMGGHIDRCDNPECGKLHISYNSCRNRHCPTCQGHKREEWVRAREGELLNVPYFHVVFTLPDGLNPCCLQYPRQLYAILFRAAWQTLLQFAGNEKLLGARPGMIAILHTWGQNLSLHPHLHCIVPGGGVTRAGNWKMASGKGRFLFNVRSMGKVFRAKFTGMLRKRLPNIPQSIYDGLYKKQWVVHAKRPFKRPGHVIEYLGRYTHKIAISNHRIREVDGQRGTVTFGMKDYRRGGKRTSMELPAGEFIRRFALHILPKGFTRIRHYGILSSSWKRDRLPELQRKLAHISPKQAEGERAAPEGESLPGKCPFCKKGRLETLLDFDRRGPPSQYLRKIKRQQDGKV